MFKKIVNGVINHKKKCIFFGALGGYGINLLNTKYREFDMMRKLCEEAAEFGEETIGTSANNRHVTVLLNPSAGDGKAKAMYEKYCAPLLHLAGIEVALVRTEREGQAIGYMGVMANTDAVVVAGGDGTLREVLTGMLIRGDSKKCASVLPLGVIPLGENNTTASSLWGFSGTAGAKEIADATMAVIKNVKRPLDVVQITPLETEEDQPAKSIYAASHLHWGTFRDTHERKSKYWYWGFLKNYMVYLFSSYSDIIWNCEADIQWTDPCSGCKKCKSQQMEEARKEQIAAKRWWHAFLPTARKDEKHFVDYSTIENPSCGSESRGSLSNISELRVSTANAPFSKDTPGYALSVQTGPEDISTSEYILEGWSRERSNPPTFQSEKLVGEISVWPKKHCQFKEDETSREYSIDNELFDVRSIRLKPIPEAVTVFAPPKLAIS